MDVMLYILLINSIIIFIVMWRIRFLSPCSLRSKCFSQAFLVFFSTTQTLHCKGKHFPAFLCMLPKNCNTKVTYIHNCLSGICLVCHPFTHLDIEAIHVPTLSVIHLRILYAMVCKVSCISLVCNVYTLVTLSPLYSSLAHILCWLWSSMNLVHFTPTPLPCILFTVQQWKLNSP